MDERATGGATALWRIALLLWVIGRGTRGDNPQVFVPSNSLHVLSKADSANVTLRCSFPFTPPLNPTFSVPTPVFLQEPEDVIVFGDDHGEIRLTCVVKNADQQVNWFFKQEGATSVWLMLSESQSKARKDGNSLLFPAELVLTPASAGYYRCSVSAGTAGTIISRSAHLQLAHLDRLWSLSGHESMITAEDLTVVGVVPGSSLSIPCDVMVTGWSAVTISWQVDGKTLPLEEGHVVDSTVDSPGYMLLGDGTLLLNSIPVKEMFDGRIFRCVVRSPTSKHVVLSKGLQVKVSSQSAVSTASHAVRIVTSNPNPGPGQQVTLACVGVNFTSASQNELKEKTNVEWFFEGKKLMPAMSSTRRSLNCSSLVAPGVSSRYSFLEGRVMVICGVETSGSYTCEMSRLSVDGAVHKQATVDINIRALPQRLPANAPSSIDLAVMAPDEKRVIDCSSYIHSSSPATVLWLYNGKPAKTAVNSVSGAWLFTINGSKHGLYQCIVSNQWGNTQVTFRVRMKSAPGRVRLSSFCDKTMRRKNYFCWNEPKNHSSAITHYLIGVRATGRGWLRPQDTLIRLANTMPANAKITVEGCAGSFYRSTGCSYMVSACNALGCGKTTCISVRAPQHQSAIGMSKRKVSAQSSSSVKLSAVASPRDLFGGAVFIVRNKTNRMETRKALLTTQGPVSMEISMSGLKSCTEYEACGQLSLSPSLSFMTFFNSSRQDCNNDPTLWQTVKTLRSSVPETAPSIFKVYRVSPTDAIITWKASLWCDTYPHTVFDVSRTSGAKSVVEKPYCVPNSALTGGNKTQVLVHQDLQDSVPYSLFASSCASNEECSHVVNQRQFCSAHQQHAVNIPETLSWPVTVETQLQLNKTGYAILVVSWAVSKDFLPLLPSVRVLHHCSGAARTSSLIRNVNKATMNNMSLVLPAQVTNCSVWLEADFGVGGAETSTKVSDVKMVERSTVEPRIKSGPDLDVHVDRENAPSSKSAASSLYVYAAVGTVGGLVFLASAVAFVRHVRRPQLVVDGRDGDKAYEVIYANPDTVQGIPHRSTDSTDEEEGPYDIPKASVFLSLAVRIAEMRRRCQQL